MPRRNWNKDMIKKRIQPLICTRCGNRRNKFLLNTLICALCAEKLQKNGILK